MQPQILLVLLGAACVALAFTTAAHAQKEGDYKRSWKGVATLKTLAKKDKLRDLHASYPIFSGTRAVAQVAGLQLKRETLSGYNAFEEESRGGDPDWKRDQVEMNTMSIRRWF